MFGLVASFALVVSSFFVFGREEIFHRRWNGFFVVLNESEIFVGRFSKKLHSRGGFGSSFLIFFLNSKKERDKFTGFCFLANAKETEILESLKIIFSW